MKSPFDGLADRPLHLCTLSVRHFFNVWVAPAVTMSVQLDEEPKTKVNIQANECKVKGSKFIEKMKINDRLKIKVKVRESRIVSQSSSFSSHLVASLNNLLVFLLLRANMGREMKGERIENARTGPGSWSRSG